MPAERVLALHRLAVGAHDSERQTDHARVVPEAGPDRFRGRRRGERRVVVEEDEHVGGRGGGLQVAAGGDADVVVLTQPRRARLVRQGRVGGHVEHDDLVEAGRRGERGPELVGPLVADDAEREGRPPLAGPVVGLVVGPGVGHRGITGSPRCR